MSRISLMMVVHYKHRSVLLMLEEIVFSLSKQLRIAIILCDISDH